MSDQNYTDLIDIEAFFAELGLAGFSEEQKLEHFKKIKEVLEGRMILRLADYITEEDEKALEGKTNEEVTEFFTSKGVNLFDIATQEAEIYKQDLISNISYAQGLIADKKGEE